jgi:hypothetical protein
MTLRSCEGAGVKEVEEMGVFRLVELESPAHPIEDLTRHPTRAPPFEPRVVLDTDAGQESYLLAP